MRIEVCMKYALGLLVILGFSALCVHLALANDGQIAPADQATTPPRPTGVFAKVPKKARVRNNPMESDPEAIAAGEKLFGQHCAQCHGITAEGGRKAPSLHIAEVQNATPGALFWVLSNGIVWHGMPDWSKLPEAQRWQITTYVKSLRSARGSQHKDGQNHSSAQATKP